MKLICESSLYMITSPEPSVIFGKYDIIKYFDKLNVPTQMKVFDYLEFIHNNLRNFEIIRQDTQYEEFMSNLDIYKNLINTGDYIPHDDRNKYLVESTKNSIIANKINASHGMEFGITYCIFNIKLLEFLVNCIIGTGIKDTEDHCICDIDGVENLWINNPGLSDSSKRQIITILNEFTYTTTRN